MAPKRTAVLERPKIRRNRLVSYLVLAAIALFLAGACGWWLRGGPASHQVTVSKTFTGTVEQSEGGAGNPTAVCIKEDDGRQVCGAYAIVGGTGITLTSGARVHAAQELVHIGGGFAYYVLLIYPPTAPDGE
jgi:hypothetical protein